jgi:hypothetical protein
MVMEAHDCNFRPDLGMGCINDRCPLHRGMRTLGENLRVIGALFASFRAGDNFGFHMGADETQCTCQWSPGSGEPYRQPNRCEQERAVEDFEEWAQGAFRGLEGEL